MSDLTFADHINLTKLTNPFVFRKAEDVKNKHRRFVHYTNAAAAMRILQGNSVWMRNTRCMNDVSEIQHGFNCLAHTWRNTDQGRDFKKIIDSAFPNMAKEVAAHFDALTEEIRLNTYVTCISEHFNHEDAYGRLSMWRAYGRGTGVAFVLKNDSFLAQTDELGIYTFPVNYIDERDFADQFAEVTENIKSNLNFISRFQRHDFFNSVFGAFLFAATCTKHPGFSEEAEWRVVYSPYILPSRRVTREIEDVYGVPQIVAKIPLVNVPEAGLVGITPNEMIDQVIIGPSEHPEVLQTAFIELLAKVGVRAPESRVHVSKIPLRV